MGELPGRGRLAKVLAGGGTAAMTAGIALMTRMPWPAAVAVLALLIFCVCLCVYLRHREQIKRHSYKHDERMKALGKAHRSQIAEVVGKFGGD